MTISKTGAKEVAVWKRRVLSRREIAGLGLEPLSDVTGALLTVGWPSRREAVIHHVIALDPERVPDGAEPLLIPAKRRTAADGPLAACALVLGF